MHKEIDISGRLKQIREALGHTQSSVAEAIGSKLRSWQQYEKGTSLPGSQVIAGLADLGVNANWVLTGKGEMLIADIKGKTPDTLDEALLKNVIEAVEEAADEDDNPACHGRRDSDQAIREEIAALHYRVRALSRLIAHLMSGR